MSQTKPPFNKNSSKKKTARSSSTGKYVFKNSVGASQARNHLFDIIRSVNKNSKPITITHRDGDNAVLISESDWAAIQETLFLQSIPGLEKSIIEGMKEPLTKSAKKIKWDN